MGWFDEQIRQRKQNDDEVFSTAFVGAADAILGTKLSAALTTDREKTKTAIDAVLRFYHKSSKELPDGIQDVNEQLEYQMHPHGIMRRSVILSKGWYRDAIGALLGIKRSDGTAIALIPTGLSGYRYFDNEQEKYIKITKKNASLFEDEAIAFYQPFPQTKLTLASLRNYMLRIFSLSDYLLIVLLTFVVTLLGLLTPKLSFLLTGTVIQSEKLKLLFALMSFMIAASVAKLLIDIAKNLMMTKIQTKLDLTIQAATMARVLSLPASFFKKYSSGELANISSKMRSLCEKLVSAILSGGLTSLFSLIYVSQILEYAPALVIPALLVLVVTVLFSLIVAVLQMRISKKQMELAAKEAGMSYAMISGIQKIKLAGAEKRAFSRWLRLYSEEAKYEYNPPVIIKYSTAISLMISGIGTIVMYYLAAVSEVSVAEYFAFNTAYGMISGAFMALVTVAVTIANVKPILDIVKPIMDAEPEMSEGKLMLTRLSGGIELNNISFRYNENMPNVIDNLSLKISPGQYVAIVGSTGCGKSTLIRLMLGLETPDKGAVYYDGRDLSTIDLKSLRKKIGVVMQNGSLFSGDIYSNIVLSAPWLTLDEAWEAAEMAGVAEDIRRMPMGMHTYISEGIGGISGGQKQRMMIARAIAPKPRILMFDEATSALDNLTQKKVSDSLNQLRCTRVVVAHRLSTIRQCDRVIYLENGRIVEDGTYDELIAKNGRFAELVERQRIDA